MQQNGNADQSGNQRRCPGGKETRNITVDAEGVNYLRHKIDHKTRSNAADNQKHYAAAPVVRTQRKHRRDQNHRAEHKRRSQQRKIAHMVPQRRKPDIS